MAESSECLECGKDIDLSGKKAGETVECENCNEKWMVIDTPDGKDIDFIDDDSDE